MSVETAYRYLFGGTAILLALLLLGCILRSLRGPLLTDRVVAVNAGTTLVLCEICLLVCLLRQDWLADVGLVYAFLGIVGMAILGKVFYGKEN